MICFNIIVRLSLNSIKSIYSGFKGIGVKKPQTLKGLEGLSYDAFSLSKLPRKVKIQHLQFNEPIPQELEVLIIPQNTGMLYEKIVNPKTGEITKMPQSVYVAHSKDGVFDKFHFIEKGTDKEIGYAKFFNTKNTQNDSRCLDYYENTRFCRNYPGYGFSKDRLIVEMGYNNNESAYGGMADLIDRLAVDFCLKNGIKPSSIISEASYNAHTQHFKRGRRFIKTTGEDINKIVSERIKDTPKGKKINTEDLGDVLMYIPKKILQKHIDYVKKNPILNVY